ncbi:TadE/TadG family type IV pilus assembly protein [Psychromonas sp. Urea-02u-13]|uniref:TadE/TadG family type IV pilus assembly protein n=1 Tax=Psychromonas sp. Urea-02u-13 TaxID=2058326 RepID=UPI000C3334D6|nr:TadE family protein [Psychromonas sp. Urea-02u-13]PKG40166.1 hypothetical protein CXF74_04970 [Psychromonas sp. Urea-02u-13]
MNRGPLKYKQRGIASVEAAFMLPVLLIVVFLFFDLARVHWQYTLLDQAMRQTLRELVSEDWTETALTKGVIKAKIQKHGYGMLERIDVNTRQYDSLKEMLAAQDEETEQAVDQIKAPSQPISKIDVTLHTSMILTPTSFLDSKELSYTSTLILNPEKLFD